MKIFLLLFYVLIGVSTEKNIGIPYQNRSLSSKPRDDTEMGRITHGYLAGYGQFPWQIGLFYTQNNGRRFCGGVLISNQWILTAAHCVFGSSNFEVILGTTVANSPQSGKLTRRVQIARYHPNYGQPANLNNDIAVIKMSELVPLNNNNIKAIRLPQRGNYLRGNQWLWVSGWGQTNDGQNTIVNDLNYVAVYSISNQECKTNFIDSLIQDYVLCTRGNNGQSICQGDSGGPLIQQINGEWTVVGVVSFTDSRGCVKGYPMGFSRVESFLNFIYANTDLRE